MSTYTTQVRWIIEQATADSKNLPIEQRIPLSAPKIFNFNYPIWDESYKTTLETKILMHYFNKDIGLETVGLWKLYLNERMNLIMPYYVELYETTQQKIDYLNNYNETYESNTQGTTKNNGTSKTLSSDLPQVNYAGEDYGTNLTEGEGQSTQTGTSTENTTRKGLIGADPSQLLLNYRQTLLNIDEQIINSLSDLFMTIYF